MRPNFPKRAVITAGMPYGNKELHLGHVGGVFIHADTYARFLRDRIGKDNVIFVSGTDCYGSPIFEYFRQLKKDSGYEGTIKEFVEENHKKQTDILKEYGVSLNLFAASGLGNSKDFHQKYSDEFITTLYKNGHLVKLTTSQFYDPDLDILLNGRQVIGQCPIAGCSSEKGYADECSLGHQYMPTELLNPKSTLSGKKPELKGVTNWYFSLDKFNDLLKEWLDDFKTHSCSRHFVSKSIQEFLEPPIIYLKREQLDLFEEIKDTLPKFDLKDEANKPSILLIFNNLEQREKACTALSDKGIRFRTGKTLVPFRLTGNIEWGVNAPNIEDLENLTVWVWPESLWAPISFTQTYLDSINKDSSSWKDWWCSKESKVYQFIGEDNVYFYGPAEMAMFMGMQSNTPTSNPKEGELQLPELIVNNHLLFLNKKASTSGKIKPPTAKELLAFYTPEQLRSHFLGLGLSIRSVGFQPKPFNPVAQEKDNDPVLKEGNLLSNVFNRAVRSLFYTSQKYFECKIPKGEISKEIIDECEKTVLEFELLMHKCEFHQVMNLMDTFIRNINKYWSKHAKIADTSNDNTLREQVMIDTFHMVKTATILMHPIAPEGTEMICEYLNLNGDFWSWETIFNPIYYFIDDYSTHTLKFLEPRVDFFKKHFTQLQTENT